MEEEIEKRKDSIKKRFSSWIKDNYDKVFIVVLIVAFILRFLIFLKTAHQPLWYDEADYLSTAKKWGLGLNIKDIWYYRRGFLWPAIGAIFFKLGLGEIGMRFLVALLSTGIVASSYFLIAKMFDKKIALLVSIGIVFSWVSLFFTGRILTDTLATFFILLALLFFWKGYVLKEGNKFLYLFGVFFALSLLTRFQFAMFALPFFIFIFTKEKFKFVKNKHLWITAGLVFAILLPFFILYWTHYGNIITDVFGHYFRLPTIASEIPDTKTVSTLFDYFKDLPYILTKSVFVLFILGIFVFFQDMFLGIDKIFKNEEIRKKFFIFLWIIVPFLFLGYITEYVEERYILSTIPFLFLIAISPIMKVGNLINKHYSKISKRTIYAFSIILLLLLLTIGFGANIPSNYSWSNNLVDNKLASYLEVKQAGEWIKEHSNPGDAVISQSRPQIIYYSERDTYTFGQLGLNESAFQKNLSIIKPRYAMLSIYESHDPWIYSYPQSHNSTWTPVQAYYQSEQPVVVIYELKED
jgi:4-amino-4-deoxy-L-arabinose transferase-like glycosyltransferase